MDDDDRTTLRIHIDHLASEVVNMVRNRVEEAALGKVIPVIELTFEYADEYVEDLEASEDTFVF